MSQAEYYPFHQYSIKKTFCAPKLMINDLLVEEYEDWSRVRSPSRAKRRMKSGHRQNVDIKQRPSSRVIHDKVNNVMYCHSETYKRMREHIASQMAEFQERQMQSILFPVMPETVQTTNELSVPSVVRDLNKFFDNKESLKDPGPNPFRDLFTSSYRNLYGSDCS